MSCTIDQLPPCRAPSACCGSSQPVGSPPTSVKRVELAGRGLRPARSPNVERRRAKCFSTCSTPRRFGAFSARIVNFTGSIGVAVDVLRVRVVLADDPHRAQRQLHLRREAVQVARQQVRFFDRHPRREDGGALVAGLGQRLRQRLVAATGMMSSQSRDADARHSCGEPGT